MKQIYFQKVGRFNSLYKQEVAKNQNSKFNFNNPAALKVEVGIWLNCKLKLVIIYFQGSDGWNFMSKLELIQVKVQYC